MIKLIRADIWRIIRKKSFNVFFIIALLYVLFRCWINYELYKEAYSAVVALVSAQKLFSIIVGVIIFNAIYADDFKAMSYVAVIGRGTSRVRVVLAKLIDAVLVAAFMYGVTCFLSTLVVTGAGLVFGETLTKAWFGSFVINFYKTIGYIALSSMVVYITNNVPLGIITLLVQYILVPASNALFAMNETLRKFHIERLHYAGLADNALMDLLFGDYFMAAAKLAFGLVVFFGTVVVVTTVLFDKKELEF